MVEARRQVQLTRAWVLPKYLFNKNTVGACILQNILLPFYRHNRQIGKYEFTIQESGAPTGFSVAVCDPVWIHHGYQGWEGKCGRMQRGNFRSAALGKLWLWKASGQLLHSQCILQISGAATWFHKIQNGWCYWRWSRLDNSDSTPKF